MHLTRNQRTIAGPVTVCGTGYWSGRDVRVEFCPAAPDTGVVFVRDDLASRPSVAATVANRIDVPRRTSLRSGEATVDMVEHVMAALSGLQIDNCEIHVDQAEMPGCDGSSLPMVEALDAAGIVQQGVPRMCCRIQDVIRLGDDETWIEARPCCSGETILEAHLDYGEHHPIGRQSLRLTLSPETFREGLATCRTFLGEDEAVALRKQGLGLQVSYKELLVFGPDGPIDNTLRFPDECVRHKLLDLVGDLALAGCDLVGRFTACRSGHRLNAELVRAVLAQQQARRCLGRCA